MATEQEKLYQQLKNVNPINLINYLDKKGWVEVSPRNYIPNTKAFVLSEVHETTIPTSQQMNNYHLMVGDTINNLAIIEKRHQNLILEDIKNMSKPLVVHKVVVEFSISTDISIENYNALIETGVAYGVNVIGSQYKSEAGKTLRVLDGSVIIKK